MNKDPDIDELRWWIRGWRWRDVTPRQTYKQGKIKYRARYGIIMARPHVVLVSNRKIVAARVVQEVPRFWMKDDNLRLVIDVNRPLATGMILSTYLQLLPARHDTHFLDDYIVGPVDEAE